MFSEGDFGVAKSCLKAKGDLVVEGSEEAWLFPKQEDKAAEREKNKRLYYPGFHPLRAVQLMRVGKLQYSQDMFPQALETLKQAYNIMKVTHGTDHSLMQALMEIKEQCEAIMRIQ
ncbi:Smyd3 [Columba guinea]|nr:Smyd3 [Columba guinea]